MIKYTSSVLAAANLLALAQALPAQPVCSVIVQVVTGQGIWVPQPDPTWGKWVDPSSKTPVASSTVSWSDWEDPAKPKPTSKTTTIVAWNTWDPSTSAKPKPTSKTTTSAEWDTWYPYDPSKDVKPTSKSTTSAYGWESWTTGPSVTAKTTSTTKAGGEFYTTKATESPKTTAEPTSTTEAETTTTTETPKATSCPYYDGHTSSKLEDVKAGGSCGASYTVNCGARVNVPQDGSVQFWERTDGEIINSLAECLAICDENDKCQAVIWTDYAGAGPQDQKHCWQTTGLPQPSRFGESDTYGQISYKGDQSGTCANSYINPPPHH